jgi:hypothetical protein
MSGAARVYFKTCHVQASLHLVLCQGCALDLNPWAVLAASAPLLCHSLAQDPEPLPRYHTKTTVGAWLVDCINQHSLTGGAPPCGCT